MRTGSALSELACRKWEHAQRTPFEFKRNQEEEEVVDDSIIFSPLEQKSAVSVMLIDILLIDAFDLNW